MDDGDLHGSLATNCFSLQEIELLQTFFKEKYDINTRIYTVPKTGQHVLFIAADSLKEFEDLIKPYIVDSMEYKLRYKS